MPVPLGTLPPGSTFRIWKLEGVLLSASICSAVVKIGTAPLLTWSLGSMVEPLVIAEKKSRERCSLKRSKMVKFNACALRAGRRRG